MRKVVQLTAAALLLSLAPWLHAQDPKAEIQKRLTSQFVLTKTTAGGADITEAGSVLVLHKDGLVMVSTDTRYTPTTTYKDGKLSITFADKLSANMALNSAQQGSNLSNVPQRRFVTGEKFWITATQVTDKHILLQLYSDPYDNVRYYAVLKFPYKKNNIPPPDEVMTTIAEVVTVEPADNAAADAAPQKAAAPAAAPPAPTKKIALGDTKDQVVATFGQPTKAATLGAKEIYYYPDMKVTFVNGKVTDVN
jgi:outer membrane protein assembly factor BamE (lipoprotein component of BamABCDE complex)